jgi:hypothetical protein
MRDRAPIEVNLAIERIRGKQRYLPPLSWLERLTQMVITEYLHRSCAPKLIAARQAVVAEKEDLMAQIKQLPENVVNALEKLTKWTAQFIGFSVINPMAPNRKWSDRASTVSLLLDKELISGEGKGLNGKSWLKDRFVGEVVGEYFFGTAQNPFRDNELLLPREVGKV